MKLIANVYIGSYNPENKQKPIARIFEISDKEKKKYEIGTNYVATDLDGPKKVDFGEWRDLSKNDENCLFFMPVYTILEARKTVESNLRYALLTKVSGKCLGLSADIDCGRMSKEDASRMLMDMSAYIIANKCITFEHLISGPDKEYTEMWGGDIRYV